MQNSGVLHISEVDLLLKNLPEDGMCTLHPMKPKAGKIYDIWTTVGWTQLNTSHKEVLKLEDWLDDKLMNSGQKLLQQQHQHVKGLQDTMLQNKLTTYLIFHQMIYRMILFSA